MVDGKRKGWEDLSHAKPGEYYLVKPRNRRLAGGTSLHVLEAKYGPPDSGNVLVKTVVRFRERGWLKLLSGPGEPERTRLIPHRMVMEADNHPVPRSERIYRRVSKREAYRRATAPVNPGPWGKM
ncbi:MAG: hypothetical protein UT63_C0111G0003 [Candidatus Gottesmanbacteria bacterium GW2011_GWC2_39_8]|uniref:Uncharacterized protein n=1 Tax=Candidatus Gottesmanbacteria bacterium GW2011_GWC2_39_8 TaxID=1618450 RepID=A0A0G0PXT5_9BACT|nr:MAG: hypothetical protein UT63_C0111G0003 [Candidatus Gottesmanbacteria bacterium GW2011_GWC2_39_8]